MNKIDLSGRIAVVTGGAQGFGRAIAERFIASGAKVAIWDLDAKLAEKTATEVGNGTKVYSLDVSDLAAVEKARDATIKDFGKIDILVNNAGVAGANATVWDTTVDEWRRVMRINLDGPFVCSKAVVPHMIAQKYGRIVNIASIAGKDGNPNAAHYSASKAGVIALTKSLGKELALRYAVNAVTPAAAKTTIFDNSRSSISISCCLKFRAHASCWLRNSPRSWHGWHRTRIRSRPARYSIFQAAGRLTDRPSRSALSNLLPVFARAHADALLERSGKVYGARKAGSGGNRLNRQIAIGEQCLGKLKTPAQHVLVRRGPDRILEYPEKMKPAEPGQRGEVRKRDIFGNPHFDEFQQTMELCLRKICGSPARRLHAAQRAAQFHLELLYQCFDVDGAARRLAARDHSQFHYRVLRDRVGEINTRRHVRQRRLFAFRPAVEMDRGGCFRRPFQ